MRKGRPGRSRLHYFHEAKIDQIAKFFDNFVVEKDKKVIQLPYALTNAGVSATLHFDGIGEPEQMIIDTRTQIEKDEAYKGNKKSTFKTEIDMYLERPELKLNDKTAG